MPEVYPSHIFSFSSENKSFPASNLLKSSSFTKWQSDKPGTKQEVVEFAFPHPVEVCRLDVGNNGSAFVETLVRRSASTDSLTVLLPCSSFMSPVDCKNETNLTRVRVFSKDQLVQSVANQKWDIFRFICTQPFNKTLSCGLSFISFHAPSSSEIPKHLAIPKASSFKEDEEEETSSEFKPGALFRAMKTDMAASSTSTASSPSTVHNNSSVAEKLLSIKHLPLKPRPVSPPPSVNRSTTSVASSPSSFTVRADNKPNFSPLQARSHPKSSSFNSSKSVHTKMSKPSPTANSTPPPSTSSEIPSTSFSNQQPLGGVIFSLSGYENPLRSELRQKGLDLGAKFEQNWNTRCTHLICAFPNTPKFKQVKGKGIIISHKWLEQCHSTKFKINWRPYRVGQAPSPVSLNVSPSPPSARKEDENDSDDNNSDNGKTNNKKSLRRKVKAGDVDWTAVDDEESEESEDEEEEVESEEESNDVDSSSDSASDRKGKRPSSAKKPRLSMLSKHRSTEDRATTSTTTDEHASEAGWTPIKRKSAVSVAVKATTTTTTAKILFADPNEEDTDDEIQRSLHPKTDEDSVLRDETIKPLPELPDIFEGKHFFVHNKDLPADEERMIQRLVIAFAGNLHTYMHPDVQYVVTRSSWNDEFDEALNVNSSIVFVRPDWLFACDQQSKWIPFQRFLVVG